MCIQSMTKYHNSNENLLNENEHHGSQKIINPFETHNLFFQKGKASIFGNFYRKEKDKKNTSIKSLPEIRNEISSLNNKKQFNKELKHHFIYIQPTINDLNIDDGNKKKSLSPIFLTVLFNEFDKRTKIGIIHHKIKTLHTIFIILTFVFIFFSFLNNINSRNLNNKIMKDGEKKGLSNLEKLQNILNRKSTKMENTLRIFNLIIVFLCEGILIKRELYIRENYINDYSIKERIVDFIITGICFPPFINPVYIIKLGLNVYPIIVSNIIFVLSFSKLIFFLKYNSIYSKWNSSISRNISKNLYAKKGYLFVLQSRIKEYSFMYLIAIIFLTILISGILLRTVEYLTLDPRLTLKNNKELYFDSMLDSVWVSITISFGVSYGDIYPRTFFGRFIIIITTIVGYVVISKILITLMSYLTLTESEKKVFIKMKRLTSPENQFLKGIKVIRDILKIRKYLIIREREKENKLLKIDAVKHLSILLLFLYNDNKNFMDIDKIDESYTIPVDDILKDLMKKIEENLKAFEMSFNKLDVLNNQLQELVYVQSIINNNLQKSIEDQRLIGQYLINLNNYSRIEKFKSQFFKKKHSSGQVKDNKKEDFFLKKQYSESQKNEFASKSRLQNLIHDDDLLLFSKNPQFKLNFTGKIKIIQEQHNEESSISNSPYLNALKGPRKNKAKPSKFDMKNEYNGN